MPTPINAQRKRAARRELGLCLQCGDNANGKSRCDVCATKNANKRKERAVKRAIAGQCSVCVKQAKPGCRMCQECIDKSSAITVKRYRKNKAAGVCRYCGKESAGKARCKECAEKLKPHSKRSYERYKAEGRCVRCLAPNDSGKTTCSTCTPAVAAVGKTRRTNLRDEVFAAYGGPVCVGCGCVDVEVLQMDHIDGGGTKHIKEIGQGSFYLWLKKNNFPAGFRVLCANCNFRAARKVRLPNDNPR